MDKYTQTAGSLTLAGGNLQSSNALLINGGTLTGAGTINGSVTSAATVAPGQAGVGALTITGNYTQTAAGTLNLELGGATVGQFDRVISSGSATLDGTLNLALTNGYVPTASDTLAIMSFASRSGQFATLSAGGSGFIALYTNTAVTLAAASGNPNPVPGVTTIAPTSATAGGASFMLTVNGTNFINSSVIKFNNNARTTTFVSATQLTAVIPSSDIAAAGTPGVTVTNPTPGGGTSTAVTFTINASGGGGAVAPVISSALSAAGLKNIPFTYIISATGTSPITFGASGLPAGLAVDTTTGIISGTPTASGGFDVVLSAQNSAGSNSKTLRITILAGTGSNAPPAFTSVPTASPNPANVSQTVTFTAAASDPDGDSVTISWDFGDGSKGSGASVTHAYAAAGIYAVKVAASDGISSDTSSLTVAVNTTTPPNAGSFSVTKGAIKFTFSAQNKDAIGLLGIVPLASGTQLSGAQVTLNFGGITKSFTLTDKGSGGDKNNSIKLSGKIKNGALTAANPQFLISIKSQTLFAGLSDFFTNDTVAKPGETDTVPVILTINGTSFVNLVNFNYISTAGKSGTGKLVP